MKRLVLFAFAALLAVSLNVAAAADKESPHASVTTVLAGLDNPSGVAVQPETGMVFVSDGGAGRILRIDPKNATHHSSIVKGFPQDIYGKGPMYKIGPLGLAFLDKDTLVVGGGELPDAQEVVRIFAVPEAGKTLDFEDTKYKLGPIGPGEASQKGEGNFYAIAVGQGAAYVTSNGDDTAGWVLKFDLNHGKPGPLTPFIKTKVATGVDAPVGITMNAHGNIVVGQMGEVNVPGDSLLTVYDAKTGNMVANAKTGLNDIASLAYSPKSKKLYCVDFAWIDPKQGGLFRLDTAMNQGSLTVTPVKLASLDKPSALAFAPDGTLYVTTFGTVSDSTPKPGSLVKVEGDL